jgi:hypothetical protein
MVAYAGLAKQINPEVLRLLNKLTVEPLLAMIIVLTRDWIITQQKAPPHNAIHDMHNRHFVSSKYLSTSQPSHHKPPKNLNQTSAGYQNRNRFQYKSCVPMRFH